MDTIDRRNLHGTEEKFEKVTLVACVIDGLYLCFLSNMISSRGIKMKNVILCGFRIYVGHFISCVCFLFIYPVVRTPPISYKNAFTTELAWLLTR